MAGGHTYVENNKENGRNLLELDGRLHAANSERIVSDSCSRKPSQIPTEINVRSPMSDQASDI